VKKWASIIQECKWRHEFYRNELDLQVQAGDAVKYLERKHAQYLPKLAKPGAPGEPSPTTDEGTPVPEPENDDAAGPAATAGPPASGATAQDETG
jgi:hypothetical protein